MRPTLYLGFDGALTNALESDGKVALPNVTEVEDPQEALSKINTMRPVQASPYRFRLRDLDPPRGQQTHEVAYYPKIFTTHRGMSGRFDGSGAILCNHGGKAKVFTFAMCEHTWDESGANHSRGWHPATCTKCGFDASIDSGD